MSKMVDIPTKECPICHITETYSVPQEGYIAWKKGTLIQRALPMLDEDQRERLITGLHGDCWKKFLGPEDVIEPTDEELDSQLGGPGPEDKDQEEEPEELFIPGMEEQKKEKEDGISD